MRQPVEIFCWAADVDRPFLEKLRTQLLVKQQHGIITFWEKSHILPGANAEEEIRQHIASAGIFLLFISSDFFADNYCCDLVLKAALERHTRREAITIPVIVRPAYWQDFHVLNRIQVLPRNGQPISRQPDQEVALWEVAQEIDAAIQKLRGPLVEPSSGFGYRPYGGISSRHAGSGLNTRALPMEQPPLMKSRHLSSASKIFSSPRNQRNKIVVMLVLLAVLILGGGTTFVALYSKISSNVGSGSTPNLTSTQVSSKNSVTPSSQAQNTPATGPTALPTAALSSPLLPLKIPCVDCSYPQLSVALIRIDSDSSAQSMRWVFSFINNGSSCSPTFWAIYLSNQSGTNYYGQGQAANSSGFAVATGQSVQLTSVFPVLPASGTQYTLTLQIHVGACNKSGALNSYQTENFTFA